MRIERTGIVGSTLRSRHANPTSTVAPDRDERFGLGTVIGRNCGNALTAFQKQARPRLRPFRASRSCEEVAHWTTRHLNPREVWPTCLEGHRLAASRDLSGDSPRVSTKPLPSLPNRAEAEQQPSQAQRDDGEVP